MFFALAVFAPLAGALVSGLLGRAIGDRAAVPPPDPRVVAGALLEQFKNCHIRAFTAYQKRPVVLSNAPSAIPV